ncbi:hypothetical protein WN51_10128 [Melipona quadrifasciata]|uniref:Uncharacterized protein n=1 Tax=Melipona quadrifasciata TaxID=166423 RepID=A0A0N0U2M5_9HYME|nr:hypothetical protein WN51_10128 [Melipona quadrifasciata]
MSEGILNFCTSCLSWRAVMFVAIEKNGRENDAEEILHIHNWDFPHSKLLCETIFAQYVITFWHIMIVSDQSWASFILNNKESSACLSDCFIFTSITNSILGGNVGLAISQSLSIMGSLQPAVKRSSEISHVASVERILEYTNVPKEPS